MRHRVTMMAQAKEYLRLRRSLGFELQSQGEMLLSFAKYLDRSGHRGPLTTEVASVGRTFRETPHSPIVRKGFRLCVASLAI